MFKLQINIILNYEKSVITHQDILLILVPEITASKDKILTSRAYNTKGSGRIYALETAAFIRKWLNHISF